MKTRNDVHQQFAEFFHSETLQPFAYLVSKKLAEGHICINLNAVQEELKEVPFYDAGVILQNQLKLAAEPLVTDKNGSKQPFVLHNNRLYLQRYFNYETSILQAIKAFIQSEINTAQSRVKELESHKTVIASLLERSKEKNEKAGQTDWQFVGTITAALNNFTIITGGPGTGKTTTVAKILTLLFTINTQLRVALAAPTGKAAVRMAESLKGASLKTNPAVAGLFQSLSPSTIHRLLGYIPGSPYFRHNKDNPVNYNVVIVDESSMIDVALFAKLLAAIGPATKLILLGDKDQLASVEAGSLFGDLCKAQEGLNKMSLAKAAFINSLIPNPQSKITDEYISSGTSHPLSEHIIELRQSHRFTSDTGIGKFSKAVISNDKATLNEYLYNNTDTQVRIDKDYDHDIFESFAGLYTSYIHEPDTRKALQLFNRQRILCAVREGDQGLYKLNNTVENFLRSRKLISKSAANYENRPVIITKNYYSLGLFNGDVGLLRPDKNGVMKAWFGDSENELKAVLPGYIAEAETVFAMTIHKSQGSEYDQVLVVLPANPSISILTRELLYTAVTRAKARVTVQATEEVILHTANEAVQRASGIMERFEED